ncbi:rod shape-determining protein MreC [Streptomyces sp. NPDC005794]|uniref:rod shape-determining protein MreC n=1 Tax=Streptomyces sp. NPDC005794 TaxID=3364733 RepID=UPI0036A1ED3A
MRASRDGRRRGRPALGRREAPAVAAHRPGPLRGLAIDLGSSGARAWVPGQGLVGGPSGWEDGVGRPVRRGRIVDPESCAGLLGRLADTALGAHRQDSVIVLSHPVLAGHGHRVLARELLAGLGVSGAVVLNSAGAVAACAGGPDGGPMLVVDMGAELTEVALLVDGTVVDARQAEAGLSDLEPLSLPAGLARNVLDMITSMWREDQHGAVRGALRRGPVLTGGGALRRDVTDRIAGCLGVPVRVDPDPSTAVVRGAALILGSVLGSVGAGAGAVSVRPVRLR